MNEELREQVKLKLARHKVSATTQRLDIGEVLFCRAQHVSAEQIIDRLRQSGRHVSKATVYNTLKLFVDEGLLREVHVDPERMFYDSTTTSHHHFYNVVTGELVDIPEHDLALTHMPMLPPGTIAEGVDVVIRVRPSMSTMAEPGTA